jgi:hypothetical protein
MARSGLFTQFMWGEYYKISLHVWSLFSGKVQGDVSEEIIIEHFHSD